MSETIKPCPFCGKNPTIGSCNNKQWVYCPNKECSQELILLWNHRPIEEKLQARIDELEKKIISLNYACCDMSCRGELHTGGCSIRRLIINKQNGYKGERSE